MNTENQKPEKALKYEDLISQSEENKRSEQIQLDVQKAKSGLEVAIAQTKLDLAEANQKLSNSKRAVPYSLKAELKAYQEVEELQSGLDYAQKVLTERF